MSELIILFIIGLCSFIIGIVLTPSVVRLSYELHLFDLPDSRKVHKLPIPRTGGTVFFPVVVIAVSSCLVLFIRFGWGQQVLAGGVVISHFLAYVAGAMILFFLGLFDDVHGIGYRQKFIVQIVSSVILCVSGLWIATLGHLFTIDAIPYWVGMPLTVLFIVSVTNAMNLIDGIDGLASGLASVSFGLLAFLNCLCHDMVWAIMSISFLGALLAFFYYNVFDKKYKVFMGDSGSLTIGFSLSFLVLHFWQRDPISNPYLDNIGIIAISSLIVPLFDMVRIFGTRIRNGRNPFLPDKNHIHHKLLRAGLTARQTLFAILGISVLFVVANWLVAEYLCISIVLLLDIVIYIILHLIINFFIARREKLPTP